VSKKKITVMCIMFFLAIVLILYFVFIFRLPLHETRPIGTSISSGSFRELSGSYRLDCEGNVELIETNDGNHVLYFSNVLIDSALTNIYMSDKTSFNSQLEDFGTNVDLGPIPTTSGSFSVSIPDNVDVSIYNTVLIANSLSKSIICYARLT